MEAIVDYRLPARLISDDNAHRKAIGDLLSWDPTTRFNFRIIRRNLDARSKTIYYVLKAEVYLTDVSKNLFNPYLFQQVSHDDTVYIVGSGPCGYFAALELLLAGIRPVVLERGKDVQSRRRDLRDIQQLGRVNPDSNYCFGEGGAGTYSDGKLYTRSDKRGNIRKVLELLVQHGADQDILVDVHPHIGSNKLPELLKNIRLTIEGCGGEVRFGTKLENFKVEAGKIKALETTTGEIPVEHLILATGHSAREIYSLFQKKKLDIHCKTFAVGLRIEHPQAVIDKMQYKLSERPDYLPPASYNISCQVDQKGVFSFCMCPGGLIIPAATAPGEIVVNGMSLSRRNSPFANSGLVSTVDVNDFQAFQQHGALKGMMYQQYVEQKMFALGDGSQAAPAQRMLDFMKGTISKSLPETSYIPGIHSASLHRHLPEPLKHRLQAGLEILCRKFPAYSHPEAVLVATESRTSAPVTIPRDPDTFMHPQVFGLYPAGEGAGYAGGILSAAMDGQRVAAAIAGQINQNVRSRLQKGPGI